MYGQELILDLGGCSIATFKRSVIEKYFIELCDLIDMQMCEIHFWDDVGVPLIEQQTQPHTKGTSAVCFILTSTIVIHTLDLLESAYINIFSCKAFDSDAAAEFTKQWFDARSCSKTLLERI